jgi:hypothetical protein
MEKIAHIGREALRMAGTSCCCNNKKISKTAVIPHIQDNDILAPMLIHEFGGVKN